MRPLVTPASTANGVLASSITIIVVWTLEEFFKLQVPSYVAQAFTGIVGVFVMHMTTDTPPPEEVKEVVDAAVKKEERKTK